MQKIHDTAVIDSLTELGDNARIGPYAVIEPNVILGDDCTIGAHAVIKQYTRMGRGNVIHEHAVIGGTPQDLSFPDCVSYIDIGNDNVIREGVTIHRAGSEGTSTRIGNNNYLMAYCHVAHDCVLGNRVILANNVLLAGHVHVGDGAFISGSAGVHQFCNIGTLSMVGHNSKVNQDCLPFVITDGVPARARGINMVGLKRAGISSDERRQVKRAYRLLFKSGLALEQAIGQLAHIESPLVKELVDFIQRSKRGFAHTINK